MSGHPRAESSLRCFPKPPPLARKAGWVDHWLQSFDRRSLQLDAKREEALACLIPALLCGEQSAQQVFHAQAKQVRNGEFGRMAAALTWIEQEEDAHERVLQGLAERVTRPRDLHRRKRRAQRFYASLARDVSMAEHFARIEALDSCVCTIMHSLARAQSRRDHPLSHLFDSIKDDEARHVGISRRYATALGIESPGRLAQRRLLGNAIVDFLAPEADNFESMGVDPDRLFQRLKGSGGR